jgi:hypothetical protein
MPPTTPLVAGAAILSIAASLLLSRAEPWPQDVPPRAHYERIWDSDPGLRRVQTCEQYLAGVLRFYSGSVGMPGWNRRRAEILDRLGPSRAADLDLLGRLLSAEWAKPEPMRRISSRTLALWGNVLREARGADRASAALERIGDDVRSVVDGELSPSAVTPERYALSRTRAICR